MFSFSRSPNIQVNIVVIHSSSSTIQQVVIIMPVSSKIPWKLSARPNSIYSPLTQLRRGVSLACDEDSIHRSNIEF